MEVLSCKEEWGPLGKNNFLKFLDDFQLFLMENDKLVRREAVEGGRWNQKGKETLGGE